MVQVFFAGQLSDKELLAKFEALANILRATLAKYEQIPAQIEPYQQEIELPVQAFFLDVDP